jgi:hypothetical protein
VQIDILTIHFCKIQNFLLAISKVLNFFGTLNLFDGFEVSLRVWIS